MLLEEPYLIWFLVAHVVPLLFLTIACIVCLTDIVRSDKKVTYQAFLMVDSCSIQDGQVTIFNIMVNWSPDA